MPSPQHQPLHTLSSIVIRLPGMEEAPVLAVPAHPALAATAAAAMAWRIEASNTAADHDQRTAPDTVAGLSNNNSDLNNKSSKRRDSSHD